MLQRNGHQIKVSGRNFFKKIEVDDMAKTTKRSWPVGK